MAKFLEVHCEGAVLLVNLDKVEAVASDHDKVVLSMDIGTQIVDESYEEMKTIIGAAQGGIPRSPGRMYDGA